MAVSATTARKSRGLWLIPAGLILLALIPIVSGSLRLTQLSGGPVLVHPGSRFTDSPIPVVLHIISATLFTLVGAFQFLPGLRRGKRSWHKLAGRVLIPLGLIVALSGLWMATLYPHPAGDGAALLVIRVLFGTYMVVSIVLAIRSLIRRKYVAHGAWMTRAYALGVAAGTQALALIPGSILFGSTNEASRAVAMGAAWIINLAVAEFVIQRQTIRAAARRRRPVLAS
jgi:uncharacterized membrane protein